MAETKYKIEKYTYDTLKHAKDGQAALLMAITRYYSGSTKTARLVSKKLEEEFSRQTFVNWVNRGHVPLTHVVAIAKALGVSPYALNYRGYCRMQRKIVPWKKVVSGVEFLPISVRTEIYKLKRPTA